MTLPINNNTQMELLPILSFSILSCSSLLYYLSSFSMLLTLFHNINLIIIIYSILSLKLGLNMCLAHQVSVKFGISLSSKFLTNLVIHL